MGKITETKKTLLDRARARGILETALKGEQFGKHPGYVELYLRCSIYNPISRTEERLPGKTIELTVSSIENVDEMLAVIRAALTDWIAGLPIRKEQDATSIGPDTADPV